MRTYSYITPCPVLSVRECPRAPRTNWGQNVAKSAQKDIRSFTKKMTLATDDEGADTAWAVFFLVSLRLLFYEQSPSLLNQRQESQTNTRTNHKSYSRVDQNVRGIFNRRRCRQHVFRSRAAATNHAKRAVPNSLIYSFWNYSLYHQAKIHLHWLLAVHSRQQIACSSYRQHALLLRTHP